MQKNLFAFALVLSAGLVYANDPPAAATPAAPAATKHACEKPDPPGRLVSDSQRKVFDRNLKKYKECIQKFIEDQQTVAKTASESAKSAYDEYNNFVTDYNKSIARD